MVFVADWFLETNDVLQDPKYFPEPVPAGGFSAQALPSGPDFPTENTQRLIVSLLYAARRRAVITTPYFIPDEALLQALEAAVLRGVEVHLVVSEKWDQLLVGLAQRSYYEELLELGVQIHLHRGKFLHAKHLSVDDKVALIGSTNMDIRSFELNAEISLLFYDEKLADRLRMEQERYFAGSLQLNQEEWDKRPYVVQLCENLARLLSPLL
jgi:cardiolipin synthase